MWLFVSKNVLQNCELWVNLLHVSIKLNKIGAEILKYENAFLKSIEKAYY